MGNVSSNLFYGGDRRPIERERTEDISLRKRVNSNRGRRRRSSSGSKPRSKANTRGIKRRRDMEDSSFSDGDELDRIMSTPKKKKMLTTSQYIFDNLFQEGKDSDVSVTALGRTWNLHKLYLCQSPYFSALFSGRWSDGVSNSISIVIDDPNITVHSLHITLGSFYKDEIVVEPCEVVSVLATASLFQLEGLISQCLVIMDETVNIQTVVKYHDSCVRYGCTDMEKTAVRWLEVNLLSVMPDNPARLREIPPVLMAQLISSPHLFVMQTEFSIYVLLRLWMFLQLHPAWDGEPSDAVTASQQFFRKPRTDSQKYFLQTTQAQPFLPVFRRIRLPYFINHHLDVEILRGDALIPARWLDRVYFARWMSLLRVDTGVDTGPQDLSEDIFNRECLRCGRTLNSDGQHMWRWTGFNAGLDLIVTYDSYRLTLKRSSLSDHEALSSTHKNRHIMYRVTVLSVNEQNQPIYKESSGIQQVTLTVNESRIILELDPLLTVFPLSLSFNFALTTPLTITDPLSDDEELVV